MQVCEKCNTQTQKSAKEMKKDIKLLNLSEIKEKLGDRNLSKLAKMAGVSRSVLYAIRNGRENLFYSDLEKLSVYFQDN